MDRFRRWMAGDPARLDEKTLERKNMFWNMVGSFVYAFASMVLTAMVNHIIGDEQGGIFAFAFSTFGQQMFTVAYFGIRPYHITDVNRKYSFGDYLALRFVTCASAVMVGIGYVAVSGYSRLKALVIILMVCYKVIDGFADVYEAEFQRDGRLFLTGKSNTFRTMLSVASFLSALMLTKNLVLASGVAVLAQLLGVLIFNVAVIKDVPGVTWGFDKKHCLELLKDCSLLFFSVFLDLYIFSSAKYAINRQMPDAANAISTAIFMPTSVINLAAGFVIRPFLTKLSYRWELKQLEDFKNIIFKIFIIIIVLTLIAVGGAWVIGVPVLGLVFNVELAPFKLGLILSIVGGGFNAMLNLFYYVLVIMKKQRYIFLGYALVCAAALFLAPALVRAGGINGGAVSYLILMIAVTLCFAGASMLVFVQEKKTRQVLKR